MAGERRVLLAGLAALVVVYLAVLVAAPQSLIDVSDEGGYLGFADRLSHAAYAVRDGDPSNFLWRGPGLPMLLAPLRALGLSAPVLRLTGPLLLALSVVLLYRAALRYVSQPVAAGGAALYGLYFPLWRLLPRIFSEPLTLALMGAVILAFGNAVRGRSVRWAVVAGLALGWLTLTRVEYGYVLIGTAVILAAWLVWQRRSLVARQGLVMVAVAFACTVPWLVYTHHETGKVPYWGNSGGLSLYWMSAPRAADLGEPHTEAEVYRDPDFASQRAFFDTLPSTRTPVARDEALRKAASRNIRKRPLRYARNLVANFSRQWTHWPYSFGQPLSKLLFYAVPGLALLAALVTALALLARRRRFPAELGPILVIALLVMGVHLLAAGYPRSIWPVMPVVFLVIMLGFESRRAPRTGVAPKDAW